MGKRGNVEDVQTRVAGALKSSELLSAAGVVHVTIVNHPSEGLVFSGEERLTRQLMDLFEGEGLGKPSTWQAWSGHDLEPSTWKGQPAKYLAGVAGAAK